MADYACFVVGDYDTLLGFPYAPMPLMTIVGPDYDLRSVVTTVSETVSTPYTMRAYDTTLAGHVFWQASTVDATGSSYTGPGPLIDIVVAAVAGT
jgi:hypothetical protein